MTPVPWLRLLLSQITLAYICIFEFRMSEVGWTFCYPNNIQDGSYIGFRANIVTFIIFTLCLRALVVLHKLEIVSLKLLTWNLYFVHINLTIYRPRLGSFKLEMELRITSQFTLSGVGFYNILKLIYGLFVSGYRVCISSNLLTSEYFSSTKNFLCASNGITLGSYRLYLINIVFRRKETASVRNIGLICYGTAGFKLSIFGGV